MLYYLDETLKTFKKEAPLTGWSQETIKALETVYSKQREHVKYAVAMERAEQKAATESDRKYFKNLKRNRRIKIKKNLRKGSQAKQALTKTNTLEQAQSPTRQNKHSRDDYD